MQCQINLYLIKRYESTDQSILNKKDRQIFKKLENLMASGAESRKSTKHTINKKIYL